MQKRKLGKSGLEVSAIGLGCMGMTFSYGPPADKKEMIALHSRRRRTRRHLLRHGRSLRPVQQRRTRRRSACAVQGQGGDRHQVRLQARSQGGPQWVGLNSRPEHIKQAAEGSLKRLKIDAIDLFYQHRVDPDVPIEDVAGAVKELIQRRQGQAFRPLRSRRADDPSRPRGPAGHGAPERILAVDARALKRKFCRPSKSSESASFPTARWARASSPARSTRTRSSTAPISAASLPRFTPEARKANQALVDLLGRIARAQEGDARPDRARLAAGAEAVDRSHPRHHEACTPGGEHRRRRDRAHGGRSSRNRKRGREDHGARGALPREAGADDRPLSGRSAAESEEARS